MVRLLSVFFLFFLSFPPLLPLFSFLYLYGISAYSLLSALSPHPLLLTLFPRFILLLDYVLFILMRLAWRLNIALKLVPTFGSFCACFITLLYIITASISVWIYLTVIFRLHDVHTATECPYYVQVSAPRIGRRKRERRSKKKETPWQRQGPANQLDEMHKVKLHPWSILPIASLKGRRCIYMYNTLTCHLLHLLPGHSSWQL